MYEMQYVKDMYNMYYDVLCAMCSGACAYVQRGDAASQAVTVHKSSSIFHAMQNHLFKQNSARMHHHHHHHQPNVAK